MGPLATLSQEKQRSTSQLAYCAHGPWQNLWWSVPNITFCNKNCNWVYKLVHETSLWLIGKESESRLYNFKKSYSIITFLYDQSHSFRHHNFSSNTLEQVFIAWVCTEPNRKYGRDSRLEKVCSFPDQNLLWSLLREKDLPDCNVLLVSHKPVWGESLVEQINLLASMWSLQFGQKQHFGRNGRCSVEGKWKARV